MRSDRTAWWFVTPALLVIAVFFVVPILAAFLISLTDFDIYALADPRNLRFVGLRNYARLLETPLFWQALGNTVYFVVVGVPVSIGVSLGTALLLTSRLTRWRSLFRTALFAPVVTTLVAVAVIWRYLLHTRYGLFNYALSRVGLDPIDWLGDPRWAMPAIILLAVWKNFGYNMIILLAGLQSIPDELYEAARIDGASMWRQFRHVTMPMLAAILVMVSILTIAGYFQLFAEPYVMTQGGPLQSTVSVLYLMYEEGFKWWNLGSASAVAFLLALNVFLLAVGCLMDIFSATVVVVPLIVPLGQAFGVDPVHLGIIFIANLELGYLTPPVGLNLFLASYRFERPLLTVYRAALPALLILGLGVLAISYVPWLTTGLDFRIQSS